MLKNRYNGENMKKTFKANNISCVNCSNLIKGALEDDFGTIEVNLESNPKEVSLEIKDDKQEQKFKEEMSELGFDVIE